MKFGDIDHKCRHGNVSHLCEECGDRPRLRNDPMFKTLLTLVISILILTALFGG